LKSNDSHIINSGENESQEFELIELGKVCKISMGQSPPSEYYNHEGHGTPFLQGVKAFGNKYPKYDTWVTKPLKVAKKGEVLFSVRAPVGEVNIAKTDVCIGRGLASISGSNNEFIFYLLRAFREKIINRQTGTVFGAVGREILESTKFPIPSETEQAAIAKILSDLDSKIELNQKMNKTLETIAQAIFKHWFIDFEFPNEEGKPYKSSGGEMINYELGKIPKGWQVKYFKDIVSLTMGVSPKGNSYNTDGFGVPLLNGAADFSNGIIEPKKFTTNPVKMCKEGDLLFCIRATIGNLTYSDKEYCIGRGVAALSPINKIFKEYSYFTLEYGLNDLISKASGSVIRGLSKDDIFLYKVLVPKDKIMAEFHLLVSSMFSSIRYLKIETHSLSNLKDSLLPKLMSGKIRVPLEE
jgi:type I restriction enzyme S subunit